MNSRSSGGIASLEKTVYAGMQRPDVAAIVPAGARHILDVGCAAGDLGAALKREQPEAEVTGIEMSPSLAEAARLKLDRVLVGTIEERLAELPDGYFDCAIFADVLEHLVNPYQVLADLRSKIEPQHGVIVASIPNIRHIRVIRDLVFRGRWEYSDVGLLDSGHLRFFTLDSIRKMFDWAGYDLRVSGINRVASRKVWIVNTLLAGRLLPFIDHQYLVTARPKPGFTHLDVPWYSTTHPL